jgi:hypothetical protein
MMACNTSPAPLTIRLITWSKTIANSGEQRHQIVTADAWCPKAAAQYPIIPITLAGRNYHCRVARKCSSDQRPWGARAGRHSVLHGLQLLVFRVVPSEIFRKALLALDKNAPHDLGALQESALLLTIAGPAAEPEPI